MEQKAPRSHQKTVWEQEKEEIEKKTAFGPVLNQFWRRFGPQNAAEKASKTKPKTEPKTESILTAIWIPVGERSRGAGGMRRVLVVNSDNEESLKFENSQVPKSVPHVPAPS